MKTTEFVTITDVTLAHVTGGTLSSSNPSTSPLREPLINRPQPPQLPKPLQIPGFDSKHPPGYLDLPRRNDIA